VNIVLVHATNWLSHVDSILDPGDARFLTIRGHHGVGKTALVEAISFALYGRGRFKRIDEPVRHGASDMSVRVEWISPDGLRYRVIRRRSTKAGGTSSLSFAVQREGGEWSPLDGDSIDRGDDSTEARIRKAVGVDGPVFEAIAFLMQGRITALVEADAAGRRDVLVSGLLLDIWPRAAKRQREENAELERGLTSKRDAVERLEGRAAGIPAIEQQLAAARAALEAAGAHLAQATDEHVAVTARIAALDLELADAGRATTDIERLEAERSAVAKEWARARDRRDAARGQIASLEVALANEAEIRAAVAALPGLQASVAALIDREAEDRRLGRELGDLDRAIRDLRIPHDRAVAVWQAKHDAAVAKVGELEAHAQAGDSVCPTCGQPVDAVQVGSNLATAVEALGALGTEPTPPAALLGVEAERARLEELRTTLGWDAEHMVAMREELGRIERVAAGADSLGRAREGLVRETATATAADADVARLAERDRAKAAEIAERMTLVAQAEAKRRARAAAVAALTEASGKVEATRTAMVESERTIAALETQLAALRADEAEAAGLREQIEADLHDVDEGRELAEALGDIPLRIIDASLPELEAEAQAILDLLDPGSTVEVTAQRANVGGKRVVSAIDIWFQDDAGRRDVRMTSGGERVAVSIALSLGYRRVLARQHGAQLRTVVIDEPDGLDAQQRLALARCVRGLVHSGVIDRGWLITHHEDLAEAGDAQALVSKNEHGAGLELVA
jgi:DNA repair exonuclease SbcCD ATPase subunit